VTQKEKKYVERSHGAANPLGGRGNERKPVPKGGEREKKKKKHLVERRSPKSSKGGMERARGASQGVKGDELRIKRERGGKGEKIRN